MFETDQTEERIREEKKNLLSIKGKKSWLFDHLGPILTVEQLDPTLTVSDFKIGWLTLDRMGKHPPNTWSPPRPSFKTLQCLTAYQSSIVCVRVCRPVSRNLIYLIYISRTTKLMVSQTKIPRSSTHVTNLLENSAFLQGNQKAKQKKNLTVNTVFSRGRSIGYKHGLTTLCNCKSTFMTFGR